MVSGVFGIANGTVLVVVVVAVGIVVVVVVVSVAAGATVANGSNVPELFDGGGGEAAGGMLFNGLNGSFDAEDGLLDGVPGFCAPGAGGKFNGAGSTATGLGGDGGGEAKVEFAKIMADKNAAATDRER